MKVELRYDPDDPDFGIWAIDPRDNQAIFLTPVKPVSMLDGAAASDALEWKRRNMKAVTETYRDMTKGTPALFEPEKFRELSESRDAAAASKKENDVQKQPEVSDEEFRTAVAAKITVEPNIRDRAKPVFLTPRDRYETLLLKVSKKEKVSAADMAFMAEFEESMTAEQTAYFASVVSMNK
jgi:hypothetical protein